MLPPNVDPRLARAGIPRICLLADFPDASRLWEGGKKPSYRTLQRWRKTGKLKMTTAFGHEYVDVHATIRTLNLKLK